MAHKEQEDKNLEEARNRSESEQKQYRDSYQPTTDELDDNNPPDEDSSPDDS